MQITRLHIRNFKAIRDLLIPDIERALILVGQNSTGKTTIMEAIRAALGFYKPLPGDFMQDGAKIEISLSLYISEEDLALLKKHGAISSYRRPESWLADFKRKFPSWENNTLNFTAAISPKGNLRYTEDTGRYNPHIPEVFPKIYYVDTERRLEAFQSDVLFLQENAILARMRSGCCMFNTARHCDHCFTCIGLIEKKSPAQLDVFETSILLDYKLFKLNLNELAQKVNESFHRNGGREEIIFHISRDVRQLLNVETLIKPPGREQPSPISQMGKGMRCIYLLSLLEAYTQMAEHLPCILMLEEPEIFLHPSLQKLSGEILCRLSRKNQVIFTTHSPNLLPCFNTRQIRQVIRDRDGTCTIRAKTDISALLDDLGYSAGDLMNVDFVFIVEGKQDKSRLPLLLEKYYPETTGPDGRLHRIAVITTNSCTNIRTYANLKYMNQIYLRDQFLMIRDGDGKDRTELACQLCRYYEERSLEDADTLPRVLPRNVLILKYYSFENYFLNPEVMARLGILSKPEDFYRIFLEKWKDYLHRLSSSRHLIQVIGQDIRTETDVKDHLEAIKTYVRGHNLFDLFYGRYKKEETSLLKRYIDLASRSDFEDIFEALEKFAFFDSRRL